MQSPTVLSVHNHYRLPGGEDRVFAAEANLLERMGHTVIRYEDHNSRADKSIATGIDTVWSRRSHLQIQSVIQSHKPQVAHFHNTFPLISPAAHYAAHAQGLAVVQTLHNYRLLCLGGTFSRNHQPCEKCLTSLPWQGVVHGCYRDSCSASIAVALPRSAALRHHRADSA